MLNGNTALRNIFLFLFCFFTLFFSGSLSAKAADMIESGINSGIGYDDEFKIVPIGFDFKFYNNTYTQAYVHSNGFITFTTPTSSALGNYSASNPIPTNPTPTQGNKSNRNFIAAFWDDLVMAPSTDDRPVVNGNEPFQPSIYYKTIGSAPNRIMIVQWTNMYFYGSTTQMGTFQAYLYEGSNDIQIQYRTLFGGAKSTGSGAVIGIQNDMATASGVQYSYHTANAISEKQAIRFTKKDNTISDYTMNSAATYQTEYLVEPLVPAPPVLSTPADGAWAGPNLPTLSWSEPNVAGQASSYKLYFSNNALFLNGSGNTLITSTISSPTTTSWQTSGLTDGATYYWRVEAINSNGSSLSDTFSFRYRLTPPAPTLTGLALSPASVTMQAGSSAMTVATATYSDDSTHDVTKDLTWTFSNAGVASINKGVVSGIQAGTTVATATYGGQSAQLNITVIPALTSLTLSPASVTMQAGSSATTVATATYSDNSTRDVTKDLTWTFSNVGVASINKGVVSGIQAGTTVATATYGGQSASLNITVAPSVTGLTLSPASVTILTGSSATTVATATYSNNSTRDVTKDLTWTFSNAGVASINNGVVSGIQVGTTVATATYGGQSASLNIIVLSHSTSGGASSNSTTPTTTTTTPDPITNQTPLKDSPFVSSVVMNVEKLVSKIKETLEANKNAKITFTDTVSHWASNDIAIAARLHIIEGYQDGSFQPNASVTRAEFSAMIVRAFDLTATSNKPSFSDINKDFWAKSYIEVLASNGIVNGYEDQTFQPSKDITRAEMLTMISRILKLKELSKNGSIRSFTDVDSRHWAIDTIKEATAAGIIQGVSTEEFAPENRATRAESLALIIRSLKKDTVINDLLK